MSLEKVWKIVPVRVANTVKELSGDSRNCNVDEEKTEIFITRR